MQKETKTWHINDLWEKEIDYLKSIVAKTPLVETVKWGGITYTYKNKNVIGIGGFKSYVGIWFFNGAFINDYANLLVSGGETTKAQRQMRFNNFNEINEKIILDYIGEAIKLVDNDLVHKPQKSPLIMSDFFKNFLTENPDLAVKFEAFTLTKKKEFVEYIDTAKQEKTKLDRLEKIKPMLMANIGLNDKYR